MVLLMSERFYRTETKVVALMVTTFVDLASLVGAYVAGSTRFMSSCAYVIIIAGVAFLCVIAMGEVMDKVCSFFKRRLPCMHGWFPVR
uniref:PGG domain-containing protein n=2 Tax=Oryza brachyantha TaxID=4533 RepID=J3MDB6_ORYBR